MPSRIVHLAIAKEITKSFSPKDANRFTFGMLLPDASPGKASHRRIYLPDGRITFDISGFRREYMEQMRSDDLYLGFYLHLVQDMVSRHTSYNKYGWEPYPQENVERLHNDYRIMNRYIIDKYKLENTVKIPPGLYDEPLLKEHEYNIDNFTDGLKEDFENRPEGEIFFFSEKTADEIITEAAEISLSEINAVLWDGKHINEYEITWEHKK